MGSDKALLCPTGEPLWARQLNLLRELSPRQLWVSARTAPIWCPTGVEIVLDSAPSCGPLSGICACLNRLQTTHLIVLAIDLPRMTADHLRRLLGMVYPTQSLIPFNGNFFEALCGIYCKTATPFAANALISPHKSLQGLAQLLLQEKLGSAYTLSTEELVLYMNLNRPEDLATL